MNSILFAVLAVAAVASANVSLVTPLDAQLPLIARVGQNYSWVFSSRTFSTDLDAPLNYSVSGLPAWLSFDASSQTFYGVPAATDEGRPPVTVSASDTEATASSTFTLCVTPYPAPTIQKPISQQFYPSNPALSSVFFLAPGSALATYEPTLRVPAGWSFSVGFDGDTCVADNDLYYAALLSDGSPLPAWLTFDAADVTFDGVAPMTLSMPLVLEIDVHCADQEGYSADALTFNLVVASHELSEYTTLPTINVTAGAAFNVTMSSPADFTGVLVDGQPLQPANVSVLSIQVSWYKDWLAYDAATRTLSGSPPANWTTAQGKPTLPVTLTSDFNQTLYTSVSLDVVPSYFSTSDLGTIQADPGQSVHFDLTKYVANASQPKTDANLSASFDPLSAGAFLRFDPSTAQLSGQIPGGSDIPQIGVTFVAYSYITHSTSHATLTVLSPSLERVKGAGIGTGGVNSPSRSRVTLIVSLVFGILGGVVLLGLGLALFRRYARVKDAAVLGEEGTRAYTDEEKRWYGIGIHVRDNHAERGYGWSTQADTSAASEKGSIETQAAAKDGSSFDQGYYPPTQSYDHHLGLGLRRVSPRAPMTPSTVQASCAEGVMKKSEFFGKIKNTARNVSDRYIRRSPPAKPTISHPIPLGRREEDANTEKLSPVEGQYVEIVKSTSPGRAESTDGDRLTDRRTSTVVSFTTSPSNSTGEQSIPRRRADFAPPNSPRVPKPPVPVAVKESGRRNLVRESVQSTSGLSNDSHPESLRPGEDRPRLKQFTHASRVPPPRSPSSNVAMVAPGATTSSTSTSALTGAVARRIASQTAQVYKESQEGVRHTSVDELRIGMHYVRTLGEGSTNVRSISDKSFSSLESSQPGVGVKTTSGGGGGALTMTGGLRYLARAGEKFKFRVPMPHSSLATMTGGGGGYPYRKLEARLISGRALPSFMQAELKGFGGGGGGKLEEKKAVEFYGVPGEGDMGELQVGVFNVEGGECLARVVVEVVGRGNVKKSTVVGS